MLSNARTLGLHKEYKNSALAKLHVLTIYHKALSLLIENFPVGPHSSTVSRRSADAKSYCLR